MLRNQTSRRRGVASMLAMLYLVLFAVLSVGFYATTTISTQLTYNERRGVDAQLAAETGIDFMRNALYQCIIPPNVTDANLLPEVHADLADLLEGTGNLAGRNVSLTNSNTIIEIPSGADNYIDIGGGRRFRAAITAPTSNPKKFIRVTVTGAGSGTNERAKIKLKFDREERPTELFKSGMVSKGQVNITSKYVVEGFPADQARIITLSTVDPPVTIGNATTTPFGGVRGDIYVPEGETPLVYAGWMVGNSTDPIDITTNHIKHFSAADAPKLPVPDTSIYRPFATNTYVPGLTSYTNIIIPPNSNPVFNGPCDIKGVVYVQQPNSVSFAGQCTITGVVVTENIGVGTLMSNVIAFSGTGGAKAGVEALPDDPEFINLKKLAGSFIVAPEFDVRLGGNFGAISGHIVGDKVTLTGATSSSVTGSLIALKSTLTITGNVQATLMYDASQGHAGLRFDDRYVPVMSSYEEIR